MTRQSTLYSHNIGFENMLGNTLGTHLKVKKTYENIMGTFGNIKISNFGSFVSFCDEHHMKM
jgi:hypothetical protein